MSTSNETANAPSDDAIAAALQPTAVAASSAAGDASKITEANKDLEKVIAEKQEEEEEEKKRELLEADENVTQAEKSKEDEEEEEEEEDEDEDDAPPSFPYTPRGQIKRPVVGPKPQR